MKQDIIDYLKTQSDPVLYSEIVKFLLSTELYGTNSLVIAKESKKAVTELEKENIIVPITHSKPLRFTLHENMKQTTQDTIQEIVMYKYKDKLFNTYEEAELETIISPELITEALKLANWTNIHHASYKKLTKFISHYLRLSRLP